MVPSLLAFIYFWDDDLMVFCYSYAMPCSLATLEASRLVGVDVKQTESSVNFR